MKDSLLAWADRQKQLDVTSKFILYRLAQFADGDCCAWAAVKVLASSCNVSERTVQYRLRELEADGLIELTGRTHKLEWSRNGREVPIFQLAPGVGGLDRRIPMGAKSAPMASDAPMSDQAMGADSAPIALDGCKDRGVMGADCCTPIEPKGIHGAYAPSASGRDPDPEGFADAVAAYPVDGLKRTNVPEARMLWGAFLAEVGAAEMVAAVRAFRSDPFLAKGDFGAPGMHRWMREERFRAYLGSTRAPSIDPAPHRTAEGWPAPPAELRASFEATFGPDKAGSYFPVGWVADAMTAIAATATARDWLSNNCRSWLKSNAISVVSAAEAARLFPVIDPPSA